MKQLTIITGASRGIGKAIYEDLIKELDNDVYGYDSKKIDLQDYMKVYNCLRFYPGIIANKYDQVNLILCAARLGDYSPDIDTVNLSQASELFEINVLGNFAVIQGVCHQNTPKKLRIVWFAGGGAAFPYPEYFGYSLTKVAVVRAVENLSIMLKKEIEDVSIIALAPGAVNTDMLNEQKRFGIIPRTETDISEPVNFVRNFITDQFDSKALNGKFMHVRDDLMNVNVGREKKELFQLRRIEE